MVFVTSPKQIELVCGCGRLIATVGMDRNERRVTADRYGFVTVRCRDNSQNRPGDLADDGAKLRVRCGNPRCRLERVIREDTLVDRAKRARAVGRRQVVLGEDV